MKLLGLLFLAVVLVLITRNGGVDGKATTELPPDYFSGHNAHQDRFPRYYKKSKARTDKDGNPIKYMSRYPGIKKRDLTTTTFRPFSINRYTDRKRNVYIGVSTAKPPIDRYPSKIMRREELYNNRYPDSVFKN